MTEPARDWLLATGPDLGFVVLSAVCIYAAVLAFTRVVGLRSFSKMSSFDFAMTVAIGSMVSSVILLRDVSLLLGAVGIAAVYALQTAVAWLRVRLPAVERAVGNEPLLLMDGPRVLHANLRRARVSEDDLRSKLREAGVTDRSQVQAVVFETTGDVSVLSGERAPEPWLLEDVRRGEAG